MRKSVLVCDDEEGVRESLKLILEKDYDVVFAENGEDAIKKMKASPIELVILDIKMPRMDGIETLRRLKAINSNIKVLITSGYKSVETAREAITAGASNYIVKPFERAEILNAVKQLA